MEGEMKKMLLIACCVALTSVVGLVQAGEGQKCSASTQDCLNYMAKNLKARGWVGIEMDDSHGKLVITRVIDDSPAQSAGLEVGDVLVAVNGVQFADENHEELKKIKRAMAPGTSMTYTVSRRGHSEQVPVSLGKLPDHVLAQWVGNHMLEHADLQIASK